MATSLHTHDFTEHTSLWEGQNPSHFTENNFSLVGITQLEAAVLLEGHTAFFESLMPSDSPEGFNMCDVEEALWNVRDEANDCFTQDVLEGMGAMTNWYAMVLAKRGMYAQLNALNMFRAEAENIARQLSFQQSYLLS